MYIHKFLKRLIIFCDNKIISHRWVHGNADKIKPKTIVNCYSFLKKVGHLLLQFKGKHIENNTYPQGNKWKDSYKTIISIGLLHNIDTSSLHKDINNNNVRNFKQALKLIYSLLYKMTKLKEEKII